MFAVVAAVGGRSSTEITYLSEELGTPIAAVWHVVVNEQELERYAIGPPSVPIEVSPSFTELRTARDAR